MKKLNTIVRIALLFSIVGLETLKAQPFLHPGVLHTEPDFVRMKKKVKEGVQPWKGSFDKLLSSPEAQLSWNPRATATVIRGGTGDNVALLYRDVAAAYQHALIWKISGDSAHANKAVQILNFWSATHTLLSGNADRYLASGLFGYQFANAAEMMRDYPDFELKRFQNYMLNVFYYPLVERFLLGNEYGSDHNDACITNYWANWDLANMAAMVAIGVFCDNREIYNKGIDYFKNGAGNGSITHAIPFIHSPSLAQWQESGRDQGHTILGVGLMASICEIAWNQGDDMYGWDDNRFRKGAEYVAKYNLGNDVPYTKYSWGSGQSCTYNEQTVVSSAGRGEIRPIWEMIFNHYANPAGQGDLIPNIAVYAKNMRPEGGPGGHATTYDQPGFGSLTHTMSQGSYFHPWESMDIGNVDNEGNAGMSGDTISIEGSGIGIQGNTDQFYYVFQSLIGDGEISARVLSIENTNEWAKAGLMISESLDSASARALMCITPLHGTLFQYRETTGNTTIQTVPEDGITGPYRIKLVRSGDSLTGYKSANGDDWIKVGSVIINMNERVYIGLAVTSTSDGDLCTSLFDDIIFIQGNIAPTVLIESPIDSAESYITGADILIEAFANDYDDSVSLVEFYQGTTKLGEDSIAPYTYLWEFVVEGSYNISVKVTDSKGANRSTSVNITVNAPGIEFPWYKFDEDEGILAVDANGFSLDANLKGGITRISSILEQCIDFGGDNDYVLLPEGVVRFLGDFTISTWVYLDALETWSRIFDFGSGTGNNMFLTTRSETGRARFTIKPTGSSEQQVNSGTALPVNKWTHIAVTLAGDTGILYINGEQSGINTEMTFRPYNMGNTNQNYLGRSQWPDPYLDGKLDDFRIYNYALNLTEIQGLVNDPAINYPPVVAITSPKNGKSFGRGDTIIIEANASDVDNNIQLVEFYDRSTKLGEDKSEPYTCTWAFTSLGTRLIKAVATSDNGAVTTSSDISITIVAGTGIQKDYANAGILIYPNPAGETLHIEGLSDCMVQLYDQSGRRALEIKVTNDNHLADISSLARGIYIVKIINDNRVSTRKLVIE